MSHSSGDSVVCVYLDLAGAVPQGSSLAGREHGDHLIQTSLQRTKHLPSSLLLSAVSCNGHVQRPRPAEQMEACNHSRLASDPSWDLGFTLFSCSYTPPPPPPLHLWASPVPQVTHLLSGLKANMSMFAGSLFSAGLFLVGSLEPLPPSTRCKGTEMI